MLRPWNGTARPPEEEFAAERAPAVKIPPFDAKRCMGYLKDLCQIGPRISGTDGMKKQQELLVKHFEKLGGKVELQKFTARQNSQRQPCAMANLIVRWKPDEPRRVILCSHYDTRPQADQEPDRRKWKQPFVSANDGGSGVAILMELAHHMNDLTLKVGVDFVLFDGEEYVFVDDDNRGDKYFFGSEHFAREYAGRRNRTRYLAAILLDMVGGAEKPRFPVEQYSWAKAGRLVQDVWGIAAEQKCEAFIGNELSKTPVQDDHLALNNVGIPAVDIIDFEYKHWHRLTDTPENCSGETMEQVARVLAVWIQRCK